MLDEFSFICWNKSIDIVKRRDFQDDQSLVLLRNSYNVTWAQADKLVIPWVRNLSLEMEMYKKKEKEKKKV